MWCTLYHIKLERFIIQQSFSIWLSLSSPPNTTKWDIICWVDDIVLMTVLAWWFLDFGHFNAVLDDLTTLWKSYSISNTTYGFIINNFIKIRIKQSNIMKNWRNVIYIWVMFRDDNNYNLGIWNYRYIKLMIVRSL